MENSLCCRDLFLRITSKPLRFMRTFTSSFLGFIMKDFIDRFEGPIVLVIFVVFTAALGFSEATGWKQFSAIASLPGLLGLIVVPLSLLLKGYGLIWAMAQGLINPVKRLGLEPSAILVVLAFFTDIIISMVAFWLLADSYFLVVNAPLDAIGLPAAIPGVLALVAAYPFTIGLEALANLGLVAFITRESASH
jgi:hypothetical protein